MSLTGARVLVTGSAGFLGGHLVRALRGAGCTVTGLDLLDPADPEVAQAARHVRGDVADATALEPLVAQADLVVHLAAQPLVEQALADPIPTLRSNVEGTWVVLEACRRADTRHVVVASSDKAYGAHEDLPYREGAALCASGPYDTSKAAADLLAQSWGRTYGLGVSITRCGNLYGPGDRNLSRIVPSTIRSLWRGEAPQLRSDGTHVRDYLYVEDAVAGYLALLDRPPVPGEAYNLGADQPHTVLEVVDAVGEVLGRRIPPRILATARAEIPDQRLDAAKARSRLGWTAKTSLRDGLSQTVPWYVDAFARGWS